MHLVILAHPYFLWVVCHPNKTFLPKEPEQEPIIGFLLSLPPDHALLPLTSPPPVLAGYRLVMSKPCACFISMYIQNLPATHSFAVVWRFVCTSCRLSLASYGFLASHSLKLASFGARLLLGYGLFFLQPTLLLFFCSLCVSCCIALPFLLWRYLTQACWASLSLLFILPSMTQYSHLGFLVTLGILGPFTFLGPFWPFS